MRFHTFKEKPDIIRLQGTELCRSCIDSNVLRESTLNDERKFSIQLLEPRCCFDSEFQIPGVIRLSAQVRLLQREQ
ncbi:hypothetical protein ATN88_13060 [Enterovibrio coralii]|uniref:Uncharacterized protein n=1 Tax=Enterovibrio coralii TaxID=294935 RepID=A0A135I303_9GAMM|nr:hypothetical protein ATN88_13060 [Enterovibrio coralii]